MLPGAQVSERCISTGSAAGLGGGWLPGSQISLDFSLRCYALIVSFVGLGIYQTGFTVYTFTAQGVGFHPGAEIYSF